MNTNVEKEVTAEMHTDYIKEDAEFFRLGLLSGYIKADEVITWADSIIAQDETPVYEILEVSTATGFDDLIVKLSRVAGQYEWDRVLRRFFYVLHTTLSQNHEYATRIAHVLYNAMLEHEQKFLPDIQHSIYYFDDGFDLADSGVYGNRESLTQELLDFLFEQSKEQI